MSTLLPARRALSLPAIVDPRSAAVDPETLLSILAGEISSFRGDDFPTHRRNAHEAIRQAAAILIFLDDMLQQHVGSPASAVQALSELHVAFQRLRLLLRDCSAPSSRRLWVLTTSRRISGEFADLFRLVAAALGSIPLDEIDASPEAKEVVRLIARQARRFDAATDPSDELAAERVRSMVAQFQRGEIPAMSELRRVVVSRLRIRSWAECDEEVLFLEEELSVCDANQSSLIGGLIGLAAYCRAALYDVVVFSGDGDWRRSLRRNRGSNNAPSLEQLDLEALRCPISLELMKDPVTLSTGQTYDRTSIVRWYESAGRRTCPVTGKELAADDLIPNSALRNLVLRFCAEKNVRLEKQSRRKRDWSTKTSFSGAGAAAAGAFDTTVAFLVEKFRRGRMEERIKAMHEMRFLTKCSIFSRDRLARSGAVPLLLNQLGSPENMAEERAAADVLLSISKTQKGRTTVFESGGLAPVIELLEKGRSVETRQIAAGVLFYLSADELCREQIGGSPLAIPALVGMLAGAASSTAKKNAMMAIFGLLVSPVNHRTVVAAGAVEALVGHLRRGDDEEIVANSMSVLEKLAETPECSMAILRSPAGVVSVVTEVLRDAAASRSTKASCVSMLVKLCSNGGAKAVMVMLEGSPSIVASLYKLLDNGGGAAVKGARSLLRYLDEFEVQGRPAVFFPPRTLQGPFIRAQ